MIFSKISFLSRALFSGFTSSKTYYSETQINFEIKFHYKLNHTNGPEFGFSTFSQPMVGLLENVFTILRTTSCGFFIRTLSTRCFISFRGFHNRVGNWKHPWEKDMYLKGANHIEWGMLFYLVLHMYRSLIAYLCQNFGTIMNGMKVDLVLLFVLNQAIYSGSAKLIRGLFYKKQTITDNSHPNEIIFFIGELEINWPRTAPRKSSLPLWWCYH